MHMHGYEWSSYANQNFCIVSHNLMEGIQEYNTIFYPLQNSSLLSFLSSESRAWVTPKVCKLWSSEYP